MTGKLDGPAVTVASVDTDGIDGESDSAGGIVTSDTTISTTEARNALDDNDARESLVHHDGVVITGPTNTNVNDLRVVVVADTEYPRRSL